MKMPRLRNKNYCPEHSRAFTRPISFLFVVAALALSLAGCGAAGGGSLHIKSAAGDKDIAEKSGYAFAVTKTFTDTAGKMTTAASYRVYVADYDLDAKN